MLPEDFIVGASTAAHQIEGGNVNNSMWAYEHRTPSPVEASSGDAADSYHRWADDLDIVRDVGLQAYRFSLEWSRIEPAPGEVSRAALAHYRRMIDGAIERGIIPVVTLHHFTDPVWFQREGGWAGGTAVERFVRFAEIVAPILQSVPWIVTINEPNMVASVASRDRDAGVPNAPLPVPDEGIVAGMTAAHHAVVATLRDLVPGAQTGWSVANQVVQSVAGGEEHAARFAEYIEDQFLRESASDDFVGVQSYTRNVFGADGFVRDDPEDTRTLTGWEYWPDALEHALRHTAEVTGGTPILVTENGIATSDDERRIAYTRGALQGMLRAMADGVDVRGYLHWSLLDNYEWGSFRPTFGLVGWDPETFDRTPKPSASWLGRVARSRVVD